MFGAKKNHAGSKGDLRELEASVELVRRRLGDAKMPLDELFRLLGADDPEVLTSIARAKEKREQAMTDEITPQT